MPRSDTIWSSDSRRIRLVARLCPVLRVSSTCLVSRLLRTRITSFITRRVSCRISETCLKKRHVSWRSRANKDWQSRDRLCANLRIWTSLWRQSLAAAWLAILILWTRRISGVSLLLDRLKSRWFKKAKVMVREATSSLSSRLIPLAPLPQRDSSRSNEWMRPWFVSLFPGLESSHPATSASHSSSASSRSSTTWNSLSTAMATTITSLRLFSTHSLSKSIPHLAVWCVVGLMLAHRCSRRVCLNTWDSCTGVGFTISITGAYRSWPTIRRFRIVKFRQLPLTSLKSLATMNLPWISYCLRWSHALLRTYNVRGTYLSPSSSAVRSDSTCCTARAGCRQCWTTGSMLATMTTSQELNRACTTVSISTKSTGKTQITPCRSGCPSTNTLTISEVN